ncbi:helix-turn-helix transcriptional regulator [Streptomyces salinarius]|uniref:helix-turn-helix transcriptional regulator n=1 Tax=Streptomyces salinarius TaxID=2762598 RepID=UPI0028529AFB|nr:helix-turn-helix transcriptional regulator [Streptomyces salinarius]
MSRTIAGEVRRHRRARGMSAQALADRCAELGITSLPRSVIANLENGRRGNVTFAEVLVLAAALDVPPVVLAFPAGHAETVEYLPGQSAPPLDARDWFDGAGRDDDSDLALLLQHRQLEQRIRGHYRRIWDTAEAGEPDGPEAQAAREVAEELTAQLREVRAEVRARGLVLPPSAGLDVDGD